MSPLNCPRWTRDYNKGFKGYNACLSCGSRHDNECWVIPQGSQKLSDILTLEERVSILEDRKESPEVNVVTISKQDYQRLQKLLLLIEERINTHIEKTTGKKRSKYT